MLDLETDVESDAECDMVDNLAVRNRILWLEAQVMLHLIDVVCAFFPDVCHTDCGTATFACKARE